MIKVAVLDDYQNAFKEIVDIEKLKNKFNFKKSVNSIEVYDNSHFSGKEAVGSFIVAGQEGFLKTKYRKFNIKFSNTQDDYSMMEEVLLRRIKYGEFPDLMIIDGGKGHLAKVRKVLVDKKLSDIQVISISKGRKRNAENERFFYDSGKEARIERNDPLFYFILRLRDEAHRFAINNHKIYRNLWLIHLRNQITYFFDRILWETVFNFFVYFVK